MKKIIYVTLIGLLVINSSVLLAVYYNQDFSSEFSFSENIKLSDVNYDYSGDYISSVSGKVGTLILENNGYFTQNYNPSIIIGCINLKEGSQTKLPREEVAVHLKEDSQFRIPSKIEIGVGDKKTIDILATYTPYSSKISLIELEENVAGLSLYILNEKERNPFGYSYYSSSSSSCSNLRINENPVKIVSLVS